jgi:hypothetical protein
MIVAYLGIGENARPKPLPGFPTDHPQPFPPRRSSDDPVSVEDAMGKLAMAGMIDAEIHHGFAAHEVPLTFEDLERFNGL